MHTFESNGNDYLFDVAWSPVHPALFACVDGAGRLDIWNMNKSIEMASISVEVDKRRALNKLKWSPRKGTEIVVGDDHGDVYLYELNENLSIPKPDEIETFVETFQGIKRLNQEFNFPRNEQTVN